MLNKSNKIPDKVTWAIRFLWASLALGILSSLPWAFGSLTPEMPGWTTWSVMIFTFGLSAALIYLTSRRYNWARIANFVFYILGIVSMFSDASAFFSGPFYSWGISLSTMLIDAVAFYWLMTGEGAAWFKRSRAD